jgi:pimeloyl-ACP methyl ester carboxylesterase
VNVDEFAEAVINFMQDEQIEKAVLVGHSMGGLAGDSVAEAWISSRRPRKIEGWLRC